MRIVLIAGLWLTSDAWNETVSELARLGHDAAAVQLPGVDDGDRSATLDDQVDAVPCPNGETYADFLEHVDGAMPFPGWEPFAGPDSADLDDELQTMIATRAVPVSSAVARGVVRLDDQQRRQVPATVVCPEFTTDQAQGWIAGGDVAELADAADVRIVDIDGGHWPMFTRPVQLARLLHEATT